MSRLIAKFIRKIAFIGVLGSTVFLGYEFIQNPDKSTVIETVKTTAETSTQLLTEQSVEARKTWQQLDLERKVSDLQDKTRPVGRKITAVVGPSFEPVDEGDRRMSLPALFLVIVFGSIFVWMGLSSNHDGN